MKLRDLERYPNKPYLAKPVKCILGNLGFWHEWLHQNVGDRLRFLQKSFGGTKTCYFSVFPMPHLHFPSCIELYFSTVCLHSNCMWAFVSRSVLFSIFCICINMCASVYVCMECTPRGVIVSKLLYLQVISCFPLRTCLVKHYWPFHICNVIMNVG